MRRRTVLGTGIAAAAAAGILPRAAAARDAAGTLLDGLHTARRERGLPTLHVHPALMGMARRHALHMHHLGCTTHAGADGSGPPARALQARYQGCVLGEALAETWGTPLETLCLWLSKAETRAVLLDPSAREVGLHGVEAGAGPARWDLITGT